MTKIQNKNPAFSMICKKTIVIMSTCSPDGEGGFTRDEIQSDNPTNFFQFTRDEIQSDNPTNFFSLLFGPSIGVNLWRIHFVPKFYSLIRNNFGPNFGDGLYFHRWDSIQGTDYIATQI